ncbi:MAG: hypothetical protein QM811_20090 [Pirellulales bacterium]
MVVAGCLALPWDTTVARWMVAHADAFYWKPIKLAEAFAEFWGVAAIMIGFYFLAPARRVYLPRLAATTFGAGILAASLKVVFAQHAAARAFDVELPIGDSFLGWFPYFTDLYKEGVSRSDFQSMPSGHSASAVVFAVALSMNFPRANGISPCWPPWPARSEWSPTPII